MQLTREATPHKPDRSGQTDRSRSEQIESCQAVDESLPGGWDYDTGFEKDLHRELAYCHIPA
jgi:hypothetical protein